jgi:uncharacterized membrane protein YqhA
MEEPTYRPSIPERVLEGWRFTVVIPVVILLLAALGAFVYGIAFLIDGSRRIVDHPFPIGKNIGLFVTLIDVLLVGTTLLISGLGLYELFVLPQHPPRPKLLPAWLEMRDLNDLKVRVISMIVLVSAVSFTDVVVDFDTGRDVLYLGSGAGALIVALTLYSHFGAKERPPTSDSS